MNTDYYPPKTEYDLHIDSKYYNSLYIEGFSLMMKDPSYCYKFYWLEAIVKLISEGVKDTTFDEVIDEMISNAWYSVREYHIHLSGVQMDGEIRDGLERAVNKLAELSNLPSSASKLDIKNAIKKYNSELKDAKSQLTKRVPYHALTGFFCEADEKFEYGRIERMTAYIERVNKDIVLLPYTLGESSNLKKEIHFEPAWIEMIQDNTVSILGWIQYEKVKWLQSNNPEVPGLVYKLAPGDESVRKLGKVRVLWEEVIKHTDIRDVFTDDIILPKKYDVDHFIPRQFVMNDELWNLMPMDSSLNSSKNNKLPKWDKFFGKFAENQFVLYTFIYQSDVVHKRFESCIDDNLHSMWATQELYRKGNSKDEFYGILEKNMQPVYDSARRQGYEVWNR